MEIDHDINLDLLFPKASHSAYMHAWMQFKTWIEANKKTESFWDEKTLLDYFAHLAEDDDMKGSTLWTKRTPIKIAIQAIKGINIDNYPLIEIYIRGRERQDPAPKQASVFTVDEIMKFLNADEIDNRVLLHKAVLIVALFCGSRTSELHELIADNVERNANQNEWGVTIGRKKARKKADSANWFPIPFTLKSGFSIDAILGRYTKAIKTTDSIANLRKKLETIGEAKQEIPFFRAVNSRSKKFMESGIGKNYGTIVARSIATFLQKPEEEIQEYSGHTFRRTSTTFLAEEGASVEDLKRFGNWTSNAIPERYVDRSKRMKRKLSSMISSASVNQSDEPAPQNSLSSTNTSGFGHLPLAPVTPAMAVQLVPSTPSISKSVVFHGAVTINNYYGYRQPNTQPSPAADQQVPGNTHNVEDLYGLNDFAINF